MPLDGVDHFRVVLVAQGWEVFELAVAGPDSLAEVPAAGPALAYDDD